MLRLSPDANPSLTAPKGETARGFRVFQDGAEVAPSDLPLQRAARGQEIRNRELEIRFDDGALTTILIRATPLRRGGAIVGAVAAAVDIATRKAAEEVLQQTNEVLEQRVAAAIAQRSEAEARAAPAQKMEAVGKLTGGVAHDFNNVLQIIGGNLQLLAGTSPEILRARTAAANRDWRRSRAARVSPRSCSLLAAGNRLPRNRSISAAWSASIDDMLRRAMGEAIEMETIIAGGLWNTFVDTAQVENALLNLAINARDAMEGMASSPSKWEMPFSTMPMRRAMPK